MAYAVDTNRLTTAQAYRARHGESVTLNGSKKQPAAPPLPPPCNPPGEVWQARAWEFVAQAQAVLCSEAGARALAWLYRRGLNEQSVMLAGLGMHEGRPEYEERAAWGLPEERNERGELRRVWLPRGVVIPWFDADLWRVNIRRPAGEPKYIGPAGWGNGLYNADQLTSNKPAIMVEGEFDAILLAQIAGDIITPVATGSNSGARRERWIAALRRCPVLLLAFDADDAGDSARAWWAAELPNARPLRPPHGDAGEMHAAGLDLRAWVSEALR